MDDFLVWVKQVVSIILFLHSLNVRNGEGSLLNSSSKRRRGFSQSVAIEKDTILQFLRLCTDRYDNLLFENIMDKLKNN